MRKRSAKFLAVLMCIMVAVVFVPSSSFAAGQGEDWNDLEGNEIGNVIISDSFVAHIQNTGDKVIYFKVSVYEDKEHKTPLKEGDFDGSEQIEVSPEGSEYLLSPTYAVLDEINETTDSEGNKVVEYVLSKAKWADKSGLEMAVGNIVSYATVSIDNYMKRAIDLKVEIYKDSTHEELITSDSVEVPAEYTGAEEDEEPIGLFTGEDLIMLDEIIDNTDDETDPCVTYVFHNTNSDLTDDQKAEADKMDKILLEKLKKCSGQEYNIKIADPDDLAIEVWTKEEAVNYTLNYDNMAATVGVEKVFSPGNNSFAELIFKYYKDSERSIPVNMEDLKPGVTYYMDAYYNCMYSWEGVSINRTVHIEQPAKVMFTFIDVDPDSPEVKQIKKNAALGGVGEDEDKRPTLNYDDLAWLNIRAYMGADVPIPDISYADSMLKERDSKLYESMVGDTKLDIRINCGGAGDYCYFSRDTEGSAVYYVDDVCYGIGEAPISPVIKMSNVLYVPEGSIDRIAAAQKRLDNYFEKGNYDITVSEYQMSELVGDMLEKRGLQIENADKAEAAYLTEYGIAFYDDEKLTSEEHFIGIADSIPVDVFSPEKLEKTGELDYLNIYDEEKENVNAYKPYKLQIKNNVLNTTQEYLYAIAFGTEEQMKEPYANWEDPDSGIITGGENGQIPIDAYTKVRIIGGKELKIIQNGIGGNGDVAAFDIKAFTNFNDGKLTDLGGGKMKVMIPLNKFKTEDVRVYYVDSKNVTHDIPSTVEEADGVKYVCFITNHFSVYAISGTIEDGTSGDVSGGNGQEPPENNGNSSGGATGTENGDSAVKTGDDFNMAIPVALAVMALLAGTAALISRKRS